METPHNGPPTVDPSSTPPYAQAPTRAPRPPRGPSWVLALSLCGLLWGGYRLIAPSEDQLRPFEALAQSRPGGRGLGGFRPGSSEPGVGPRVLTQVQELVDGMYVDSTSRDSLALEAAKSLVASLKDPYSEVLPPRQIDQLNRQLGERYGGIGVSLEPGDTVLGPAIVQVFPGSPASAAGIEGGDRILSVNDTSVRTWQLDKITMRITGPLGSPVRLQIQRPGGEAPRTVTLKRSAIQVSSLGAAYLDETGTAVISLENFSGGAAAEIADSLAAFEQRGAKRFLLDLRGNPGGRLEEATALADLFLNEGEQLARVDARPGAAKMGPQSLYDQAPARFTMPMAVLVDAGSASASEIVTGALQDHDRALVVGWPTFGKGLVQTIFPLDGGYALKLTTGKWITPSGRSIHRERKETDTVTAGQPADTANRPVVRSAAGRLLRGGGGIVPDLLLLERDTLTASETRALRTLRVSTSQLRHTILDVLRRDGVAKGRILPAPLPDRWIDQVMGRLTSGGQLPAASADGLRPTLKRWIEDLAIPLSASETALYQHRVRTDPVFQAAMGRLRTAPTAKALLDLPSAGTTTAASAPRPRQGSGE